MSRDAQVRKRELYLRLWLATHDFRHLAREGVGVPRPSRRFDFGGPLRQHEQPTDADVPANPSRLACVGRERGRGVGEAAVGAVVGESARESGRPDG